MTAPVQIIGTVVMLALLVFALVRKANIVASLIGIGILGQVVACLLNGVTPMGDASTGSFIIDIFESIGGVMSNQAGNNGLIIMSVIAYVAYMDHLKASTLFGIYCARPLKKLKNPYILVFFAVALSAVLKMVIASGIGLAALLLSIVYPILRSVGVSKKSSAVTVIFGYCFSWAPVTAFHTMLWGLVDDMPMTIAEFFATRNTPISLVCIVVAGLSVAITCRYFDKKEGLLGQSGENIADIDPDSLGIPKFYALLPLLPLVFLIVFSSLVVKTIVISILGANLMAFTISYLINLAVSKNRKEASGDVMVYFKSMGSAFGSAVSIIIAAGVFSAGLNAFDGMSVIFASFSGSSSGAAIIGIVGALLAFAMVVMTGAITSTVPMFVTMYAGLQASGIVTSTDLIFMFNILSVCATWGATVTPVAAAILFVADRCDMRVTELIKRDIIPCACCVIATIVTGLILY